MAVRRQKDKSEKRKGSAEENDPDNVNNHSRLAIVCSALWALFRPFTHNPWPFSAKSFLRLSLFLFS
jgi:hypothetical protein